ncbi:MAG: DNA internalization-related competence protein ComEC/Rec2 [Gammaproteobacteria bacterium]
MVTGSGLFLLGILTLLQFPALPPLQLVMLLPFLVLTAVLVPSLRIPSWYACGFLWVLLVAHQQMDKQLAPELQGIPLEVRGHVVSLPELNDRYIRFEFEVSAMYGPDGGELSAPGRIRLNWYRPFPSIRPGSLMSLTVKLKRPHGYMNPGGFDYEGWLFRNSIRARGYVLHRAAGEGLAAGPVFSIHRWRHMIREKLEPVTRHLDNPALIKALALGDRSDVDRLQWRVLNRTGTNHLLAISGLHIGLVAAMAFFLSARLWPLAGRTALWLPAPHVAALVSLTSAAVYAMLAGFTVPTRRALVMLATLLLARLLYRHIDRKTGFCLALLAVLILDPFAVMAPGFWLSFAAVAIILLALSGLPQPAGKTGRFARVQWFLFLGLGPLLAFWFHQIPLLSILANSLAIPWISMAGVPPILSGTLALGIYRPPAEFLLALGDRALTLIWVYLQWLAGLEMGVRALAQTTLPALLAALIGAWLLLLPRGTPAKWMGVFWFLPLLFPRADVPEPGTFRFTLLDVGQGLAAVVQTRNHVLTYDTGPAYGADFNTGWAVVEPYLRHTGVDHVDIHVQSHGDNDHLGGLEDLLAAVPVGTVLYGEQLAIDHPRVRACLSGETWEWDGVRFRILHPPEHSGLRGNDRSCVLRVSAGAHSVLLTGDIERRGELTLLKTNREKLDSTILVVPHHGSMTSSNETFVHAVSPRHALFSTGYLNRYGFPKKAIIDRYRNAGANLIDTAVSGAIEFHIADEKIDISSHREESRRFWHNRP